MLRRMTTATLARITRFPVKGLSGQTLPSVDLVPDEGVPDDRRFALAHGASAFDPDAPAWKPKSNFLVLAKNQRLAQLDTDYDSATTVLTIRRAGRQVARGDLSSPTGRLLIQQFFAAFMGEEAYGKVRVVEVPGFMFSDVPDKVLSLINAASLVDLERVTGAPVDPRRLRGNLLIEGAPAWAEFAWVDREITVGGVRFAITGRIDRCAATEVNPETGERDMMLPRLLRKGYGHIDCGVYVRVLTGGRIATGDAVTVD
jgi:uncharacterized protein